MVATRKPESKKPNRLSWAKPLILLVGRDRFELSTYGLRVPNFWHFSALSGIHAKREITLNQRINNVANNPHVEQC